MQISSRELRIVLDFLVESVPENILPQTDGIFVFGHYEPMIAHHAAKLWKRGGVRHIVISGKGRDKIPAGFETEADFYASVLEFAGVPKEALIFEKRATNTLENVIFGMDACRKAGFFPKSLLIVAVPPLLRRSCATFRKQFPDINVFGSAFPIPENWYEPRRILRLLAEFDRLDEYAKKGDIVSVKIPEEVSSAAKKIRTQLFQLFQH